MRVVAGSARGRRLEAPEGESTRPTGDRVREAVFNSLHSLGAVEDATVLDLFAGSGALGIEALSRGAAHATFVDTDRRAIGAIEANLAATGLAERATVLRADADSVVARAVAEGRRWDLALLDPPYAFDGWADLLAVLPGRPGGRRVGPEHRSGPRVGCGQGAPVREYARGRSSSDVILRSPDRHPTPE